MSTLAQRSAMSAQQRKQQTPKPQQKSNSAPPARKPRNKPRRKRLVQSMTNMSISSGKVNFTSGRATRMNMRNIVTQDEYIQDLNGSTAFATTAFPLNPGQVGTFPWLSKQAQLFEKYRFLSLEFYYKPQVSAFATNGQSGKVILSFDTDASDPAPLSKIQVEDTFPHEDAMPYEDVCLKLNQALLRRLVDGFYVRPGPLPGGTDIKTYDVGTLYASTSGNTNNNVIGELRIKYSVELMVPVLETTTQAPVNFRSAVFGSTGASEPAGATTVATTMALATVVTNGLGAVNTVGVITLPVGNYLITGTVVEHNSAAALTAEILSLLVNGASMAPSILTTQAAGVADVSQSGSWFVASNGTTTVALQVTLDYAAGASTLNGLITINSI